MVSITHITHDKKNSCNEMLWEFKYNITFDDTVQCIAQVNYMTFVLVVKCIIYSIQKILVITMETKTDENSSGQSKKIFIILSDTLISN
jgi:hypothetical protein